MSLKEYFKNKLIMCSTCIDCVQGVASDKCAKICKNAVRRPWVLYNNVILNVKNSQGVIPFTNCRMCHRPFPVLGTIRVDIMCL